jgi:hypothetical protein
MRRILAFLLIAYFAISLIGVVHGWGTSVAADQPPAPSPPVQTRPANPSAGATPPTMAAPADSFAAERDSLMNDVLKKIAGRESAPAESVFKEIRILKGMPAGRMVRVMNLGFGKSLGVSCTHCHVAGEYAKEDKAQKQVARDMWEMVGVINNELLPKIKHLKSERPSVNCTTCHRGQVKPATNL